MDVIGDFPREENWLSDHWASLVNSSRFSAKIRRLIWWAFSASMIAGLTGGDDIRHLKDEGFHLCHDLHMAVP